MSHALLKRSPAALIALLLVPAACRGPAREGVDEKLNFLPLARYETSENPPGYALDALWPLIRVHREGEAHGSRAFPLWIHEDDGEGEDFLNLALLFWRTTNDRTGSIERTLFPVFFQNQGPHRDKLHVWPLYGFDGYGGPEAPARTDTVLGPVFEWDRSEDGAHGRLSLVTLWPLFALWRHDRNGWVDEVGDATENRELHVAALFDELFALLHHDRQNLVVDGAPVEERETKLLRILDLFRLFETGRTDGRFRTRFLGLFDEPWSALYARFGATDDRGEVVEEWNHLFPIWFHGEDSKEELALLFPLFGRLEESSGFEKTWLVPPFFSHETDPAEGLEAWDAPWPLWRYESRTGDDPGWHLRLLPLLWFTKRAEADVSVVLPLWYRIRDAHSEYVHLVPLWGRHVEEDGARERTFWLPPLWIHTTDDASQLDRHDVLWPIARFESSALGTQRRIFPLFAYESTPDDTQLNVLGVFHREKESDRSETLLWPLFGSVRADGAGTRTSVLPLLDARFLADDDPTGEKTSVLWPLASFERDGDETKRWVFPFFWWFDDGPTDGQESHRHLWPLIGRDEDAGLVTWSTLWPLFSTGSNEDGSRSRTNFLWPLGAARREGETATRWLFPLFYDRTTDGEAGRSRRTWSLWPLFSREASVDGSSTWHSLFHLLRYEDDPAAGVSEFSILGGFYRDRTEGAREIRSLAFLYGYEEDGDERTLRLFHLIPIRW